jgi:hypothetical protein
MARQGKFSRKCRFEALEGRRMMAGDVSVRLSGGSLLIDGDFFDNAVSITAGAIPFQVIVAGSTTGGAPTKINGVPNGVFTLNNFTNDLRINMGAGNDTLVATGATVRGNATVSGGAGNDFLNYSLNTFGNIKVSGGGGADLINVTGAAINGALKIKSGTGNDSVAVAAVTAHSISSSLGNRNDTMNVSGTTTAKTTLNGNSGVNKLTLGNDNFLFNISIRNFF